MEQRNGRIDRFGQTAKDVLVSTLHSKNNPVDDIVLNVLYKKQEEIRKKLGVYLPIADNDASLMESIMQKIFDAKVPTRTDYMELSLFDSDPEWKRQQDEEIEIQLKKMEENCLSGRSQVGNWWSKRHSWLCHRATFACRCQRTNRWPATLLQLQSLGIASQLASLFQGQSHSQRSRSHLLRLSYPEALYVHRS